MKAYASSVIEAPAREVWKVVSAFDRWWEWHPAIQSGYMEDQADPHAVGSVRRQVLATGKVARAVLSAMDSEDLSLTYEMIEGPYPVNSYFSTISIHAITANNDAFVEWWGTYEADEAQAENLQDAFGRGVYMQGLQALSARLKSA